MAETLPPLQIPITGDATGAVNALESARKKVAELAAQENILRAAMDSVNKETEEGARTFALLKAELDKLENKTVKFNVASDNLKNISKDLNERVGKFTGVLSSMGNVAGESGGKIGAMATASAGLAQAFAQGGPIALGVAAATAALGQLNDKIADYIDKASEAETKRIVGEVSGIVSASAPGRESSTRIQELKERLGLVTEVDRIRAEVARIDQEATAIGARFGAMAAEGLSPEQRSERQALERTLLNIGERRALLLQLEKEILDGVRKAKEEEEKRLAIERQRTDELKRQAAIEQARRDAAFNAAMNPSGGGFDFTSAETISVEEKPSFSREEAASIAEAFSSSVELMAEATEATEAAIREFPTRFKDVGTQIVESLRQLSPQMVGLATSGTSGLGAAGGIVGSAFGPIGSAVGTAIGGTAGTGIEKIINNLGVFDGLIESLINLFAQFEPNWRTTADGFSVITNALQYASIALRPFTQLLSLVQSPMGALYDSLADLIESGLVPFAIAMTKVTNGIVDFVNTISRWMNETLGTDLEMLSHVIVDDLINSTEAAGESIRENLTDEFANLPPGFKTNAAIFGATDAGVAGGGAGTSVNIGVVNVTARGTLLDELNDVGRRANLGSSGIIGGRTTVQDRRN